MSQDHLAAKRPAPSHASLPSCSPALRLCLRVPEESVQCAACTNRMNKADQTTAVSPQTGIEKSQDLEVHPQLTGVNSKNLGWVPFSKAQRPHMVPRGSAVFLKSWLGRPVRGGSANTLGGLYISALQISSLGSFTDSSSLETLHQEV